MRDLGSIGSCSWERAAQRGREGHGLLSWIFEGASQDRPGRRSDLVWPESAWPHLSEAEPVWAVECNGVDEFWAGTHLDFLFPTRLMDLVFGNVSEQDVSSTAHHFAWYPPIRDFLAGAFV